MNFYSDIPVRADVDAAHKRSWRGLGQPGNWLTGCDRVHLAHYVRSVIFETRGRGEGWDLFDNPMIELAYAFSWRNRQLTRNFYGQMVPDKISAQKYVEVLAVTVQAMNLDVFARAAGLPFMALPSPEDGATPGAYFGKPDQETAWVPMVYSEKPNIERALSIAPHDADIIGQLVRAQYRPMVLLQNTADVLPSGALSHVQIELIAARTSMYHRCFY